MKIVGLDLSLTSTGVAILEWFDGPNGAGGIDLERLQSKGAKTATLAQRHDRVHELRRRIWDLARGADLVVVEGPSFGQQRQGGTHDRAGLWWLVVDWLLAGPDLSQEVWPSAVAEVPPAVVKKYATGKGNAGKDEVLAAVVRRYAGVPVEGNDTADALVLAAMGARHVGYAIDELPQVQAAAVEKVAWPELSKLAPFPASAGSSPCPVDAAPALGGA